MAVQTFAQQLQLIKGAPQASSKPPDNRYDGKTSRLRLAMDEAAIESLVAPDPWYDRPAFTDRHERSHDALEAAVRDTITA